VLPGPGLSAYAAAKAGVEAMGNALRVEVQGFGVKVGVAYFSWIDTEMVRGGDRTELGSTMRGLLKGPIARTSPLSEAAEAVVQGIERRRRVVVCPRWLPALMALRPLMPRLTELVLRRDVAELDRIAEREARERGSHAVGAGGEADREARYSSRT
jgi:short-subunit dehydrogenase